MANEIVTRTFHFAPHYLPVRDVDRAHVLCTRINAVADCIGAAADTGELDDESVQQVCNVIREMMDEVHEIVHKRVPAKPHKAA